MELGQRANGLPMAIEIALVIVDPLGRPGREWSGADTRSSTVTTPELVYHDDRAFAKRARLPKPSERFRASGSSGSGN